MAATGFRTLLSPFRAHKHLAAPRAALQRGIFSTTNTLKRLRALEEDANKHPDDTIKQLQLMKLCNDQNKPSVAAARFESGMYANDEQTAKEYIRALSLSNQISRLSLNSILASLTKNNRTQFEPLTSSEDAAAVSGRNVLTSNGPGSADSPLHVQFHENPRATIWKMMRQVLLAGGIMFVAYNMLGGEARGLPKGLGLVSDVQPVTGSPKRFSDVVGVDEAIEEVQDIVKYLRSPKYFTRLGGRLPKGVLLTGPPGTGKTLLARAVAGEAGVPFFYMSGSEFEEVFVGVGAKRVRELFAAAKKRAPCIIFIDEIDAIGSHRNPKEQQAVKMTLNQLLTEMDGFQQNTGVIVLAATNFPEALDRALVRPGRFDTNVVVPLPDVRGRQQILELYVKPVPTDEGVELETIARATPGFSGADLSNLVNVAALHASHGNKSKVSMADFEYACDKIRMGAERKSAVISPDNLKVTAYHEGGHALVALHTPGAQPIHKATIVPRGNTLGMVAYLPERDQLNLSREQMLAYLDICMGGRVAEELKFGKSAVTTGASSDLEKATSTARSMITKYGFSETLGPLYYSDEQLDKLSTAERASVEKEVRQLCTRAEANARRILTERAEDLERLALGLLEHETLSPEDITAVLAGQQPSCAKSAKVGSGGGSPAAKAGAASAGRKKATIVAMGAAAEESASR